MKWKLKSLKGWNNPLRTEHREPTRSFVICMRFGKLQRNKNGKRNKPAWCLLESAVGPICGAKFVMICILCCYTLYFSCYSSLFSWLFFPTTVTELDFTILLCEYRASHSVYCYRCHRCQEIDRINDLRLCCHAARYRLVFHCRLLIY